MKNSQLLRRIDVFFSVAPLQRLNKFGRKYQCSGSADHALPQLNNCLFYRVAAASAVAIPISSGADIANAGIK